MKERILIIGLVWPEPASSAAGSRMMQLISVFSAQGWDVIFACAAARSDYSADLRSYGVTMHDIRLNHSSFDDFIQNLQPGLVLFDRFMTEEQYSWRVAEWCPNAIRVLDSEDLHFLRKARQKAVIAGLPPASANLFVDDTRREIASILRCDLTLVISSFEMQLLQAEFEIKPELLLYLPFLSEEISAKDEGSWPPFEARSGFIFIGNYHHEPNRDAVVYLKKTIWPEIRRRLPAAEMHIYGAYMPESIQQFDSPRDGFLIHGRASDAMQVISESRVMLAPLRFGAGLKGKLLEAMLCGTPSMTTTVGAEGMYDGTKWNGCITDDPTMFAELAARLYQDKELWNYSSSCGVDIHNQHFLFTQHVPILLTRLISIGADLDAHRRRNFLGSILLHSIHNATRYMSKWIEAKNNLKS